MLEGLSMDRYDGPILPATLVMPALSDLRSLTRAYLDRFGTDGPSVGQTVLVRGEHGSGKTHAIGYLIGKVMSGKLGAESVTGEILQLYAKAEAGDIVAVYRSLLAQLSLATLRELALRFTAEIAGAAIVAGAQGEGPEDLFERLRKEPQLFKEMLRVYYVDESEVLRRRDEEIVRLTGESTDFVNAFSWIDSEIGELAHRWLTGDRLEREECRQLGVAGAIDTVETARSGLRLLAALCSRSDRPLIVYVDQYEKLVLEDGGQLNRSAAGAVHTLAEVIPQEDAMLVLSGNDEAWAALPPDLKQRFGPRVVECRGLGLDEAAALAALYLHPRGEAQTQRPIDFHRLKPFTMEGFKLLHLYSGGNARRLLELCAVAYEASGADGVIDREKVCVAADEAGNWRVDVLSTIETMMRIAAASGYAVRKSDDLPVELRDALVLSVAGRDRIQIVLGQAAHYYREVIEAASFVALADDLRSVAPGVRILLIVLGYESVEIRAALTRVGIEVLRFRPQTFAADFGGALDRITQEQREEIVLGEDRLATEVSEVRSALQALRREREADTRGLVAQTVQIDARYERERAAERWEQATRDWVSERGRLEGGIREARQRRRDGELEELSRLREHAEGARRNRQLWAALGLLIGLATATLGFVQLARATAFEPETEFVLGLVLAGVGLAILMVMFAAVALDRGNLRDALRRSRAQHELAMPVSSAEDLRRLARRASVEHAPLWSYLRHENPQVRFIAALAADGYEVELLVEALLGERCALVRKAYAKRIGESPEVAFRVLDSTVFADTPEAAYVLEGALRRGEHVPDLVRWHPRLSYLVAVISREVPLSPASRVLAAADARETNLDKLDAAIAAGLPLSARGDLVQLSAESLRTATRAASPFEDGALGTLDDLLDIDDVDSAFLALSQLLFMSELGLLVNHQ
jgi:hypothetical protein